MIALHRLVIAFVLTYTVYGLSWRSTTGAGEILLPVILVFQAALIVHNLLNDTLFAAHTRFTRGYKHQPSRHLASHAHTLGSLFRRRRLINGSRPAFWQPSAKATWSKVTWDQWYDQSSRVANAMLGMGVEPGDRVAILAPTSGTWAVVDMAAQLMGAVSFGIYQHQTSAQITQLLEHSGARVLFVEGQEDLDAVVAAVAGNTQLLAVVVIRDMELKVVRDRLRNMHPALYDSSALWHMLRSYRGDMLSHAPMDEYVLEAMIESQSSDDVALFVYTSGTTGEPKAAMLTHASILQFLTCATHVIDTYDDDLAYSFLPMPHVAERVLSFYGRISSGITTVYASSTAHLLSELTIVRPTLFGSVPRVLEKAYNMMHLKIQARGRIIAAAFQWAESVGRRYVQTQQRHEMPSLWLAIQYLLANQLVFRQLRNAFGGRVRRYIVGAAPTAKEMVELFVAAGIPVYEVYGMTETCSATHANTPAFTRIGSVGRAIPGIETKIETDGEICVRGGQLFRGYFRNEEATRATLDDDGWLHTGDLGRMDADGALTILGRRKDVVIPSTGKNVNPNVIEQAVKVACPLVSHVVVCGDARPFLSAIVAPSPMETLDYGVEHGVLLDSKQVAVLQKELLHNVTLRSPALDDAMANVVQTPGFRATLRDAVAQANLTLAKHERLGRILLLPRDLSLERGEMTATMKVKRNVVTQAFLDDLDDLYHGHGDMLIVVEDK